MAKILKFEDNIEIRENSKEILELEGHTIITAENGLVGLKMAYSNLPEIILCDIMMPELNGYEVLKELKKNEKTCQIPFIFISASTESKDLKTALNMGATAYIKKPFEVEELVSLIDKCLSGAKTN